MRVVRRGFLYPSRMQHRQMSTASTRKPFVNPRRLADFQSDTYACVVDLEAERQPARTEPPETSLQVVRAVEAIEAVDESTGMAKSRAFTVPWTEERLLVLLQTASVHQYPTIFFKSKLLQHGKKMKAMQAIRAQLEIETGLFPTRVPLSETLDRWIDDAVNKWCKVSVVHACSLHNRS